MLSSKKTRLGFKSYVDSYIEKYFNSKGLLNIKGVYDYLYIRLYNAAVRTLIKEMYFLKESKDLIGENSEERYNFFEKLLETEEMQKKVEEKYPVLKENMIGIVEKTAAFIEELVFNFEIDLPQLNEKFDSNIRKIVKISAGEGDTHNAGKSVVIVTTNSSKLVYKPHSFDGDFIFDKVIEWINCHKVSHELKSVKFYSCGEHGWQEYIEYDGYLDDKQAKDYYYRCGEYLFLFYILGSTDMHFQNVIVQKDYPLFVDLETVVSIPKCLEFANVLETAYLPRINKNDINVYDFDFSGLCASGNFYSDIKSLSIIDPFTDKMRIENISCYIAETKNCVYVNGEKVAIENYDKYILSGFEELWRIIERNKVEFTEYIENLFNEHIYRFRQVLRSTQVYCKFLAAASHPDFLVDRKKRDDLFRKLKINIVDEKIADRVEDEIRQMEEGDVPYYCAKYDSKDLISSNKIVCKDYYQYTIKEGLCSRIQQINENVLILQKDIIKKSIFTAYTNQYSDVCIAKRIEKNEYSNKAALEIKNRCIGNTEGVSLLINTLNNEGYSLDVLNLDMFEGGGIIWYLACVGYLNKMHEYISLAYDLFQSTEAYWNIQIKDRNDVLSAFFGEGSILYLVSNLTLLDEQGQYDKYFEKYLKRVIKRIESKEYIGNTTEAYSYLYGSSGVLVVICRLYDRFHNEEWKHLIRILKQEIALYLAKEECNKHGFFDGISGMAYALTVADYTLGECEYREIVGSILYREYKDVKAGIYKDCSVKSGWAGMIFVRAFAYNCYKEKRVLEQVNEIYEFLQMDIRFCDCNNNLLNGRRGIKEMLGDVEQILPKENKKGLEFDKIVEYDDLGLFNEHKIENFMAGTSGIAYSYLRNLNEKLPSVITLGLYNL